MLVCIASQATIAKEVKVGMGSVDANKVRSVMGKHIAEFRKCYKAEIKKYPEAEGEFILHFSINSEAKVIGTIVVGPKDKYLSEEMVTCMDAVLQNAKFPKPKGGGKVDIKQPINFTKEKIKK